jgi:hypothetical protein
MYITHIDVLLGFILLHKSKKLPSTTETTTSILALAAASRLFLNKFQITCTSNAVAYHFSDIIVEKGEKMK